MTTANIDNSASGELDKLITWQYDQASNLCGVIDLLKDFFNKSTEELWSNMMKAVKLDDEDSSMLKYGLTIWGKLLDIPRITYGDDDTPIDDELYKKLICANLVLSQSNATLPDYETFCDSVFGDGNVSISDNGDMSLSFSKESGVTLEDAEQAILDDINTIGTASKLVYWPSGVQTNQLPDALFFDLYPDSSATTTISGSGGLNESIFDWQEQD